MYKLVWFRNEMQWMNPFWCNNIYHYNDYKRQNLRWNVSENDDDFLVAKYRFIAMNDDYVE